MNEVRFVLRSAENDIRKASLTLSRNAVGGDIVAAAVAKWKLPEESGFELINERTGQRVTESDVLTDEHVRDGDVLVLQPGMLAA